MGGLQRASGHAASEARTTSNSGIELPIGAAIVRSMGFVKWSKSAVDRMLVPRVCIDPRDDELAMGSDIDDISLTSLNAGIVKSGRLSCMGPEYISRSME